MKLRMIVDTVMLFLFLAILDYRQIGSSHHEIFGMIFFVIVIFHNYLNRQWYKSLPRGRWNWDRRFTFLIDVFVSRGHDHGATDFLQAVAGHQCAAHRSQDSPDRRLCDARCNWAAPGDPLERSSSAFQEGSAPGKYEDYFYFP